MGEAAAHRIDVNEVLGSLVPLGLTFLLARFHELSEGHLGRWLHLLCEHSVLDAVPFLVPFTKHL